MLVGCAFFKVFEHNPVLVDHNELNAMMPIFLIGQCLPLPLSDFK